jgi:hypothetical protein
MAQHGEKMKVVAAAMVKLRDVASKYYNRHPNLAPTDSRSIKAAEKSGVDPQIVEEAKATGIATDFAADQKAVAAAVEGVLATLGGNKKLMDALIAIHKSRVLRVAEKATGKAEGKVITSRSRAGGARRVWLGRNGSILEDGRVSIEGVSGTRAGSMNAVVYAYG